MIDPPFWVLQQSYLGVAGRTRWVFCHGHIFWDHFHEAMAWVIRNQWAFENGKSYRLRDMEFDIIYPLDHFIENNKGQVNWKKDGF